VGIFLRRLLSCADAVGPHLGRHIARRTPWPFLFAFGALLWLPALLAANAVRAFEPETVVTGLSPHKSEIDKLLFPMAFSCAPYEMQQWLGKPCLLEEKMATSLLQKSSQGTDLVDLLIQEDAQCLPERKGRFVCRITRSATRKAVIPFSDAPPRVIDSRFELTIVIPRWPGEIQDVQVSFKRFDTPRS
jgi:hypothetical protein